MNIMARNYFLSRFILGHDFHHLPLMSDLFICLWSNPSGLKQMFSIGIWSNRSHEISSSIILNFIPSLLNKNRIKPGESRAPGIKHWPHFSGLYALSWGCSFSARPRSQRKAVASLNAWGILFSTLICLDSESWQSDPRIRLTFSQGGSLGDNVLEGFFRDYQSCPNSNLLKQGAFS